MKTNNAIIALALLCLTAGCGKTVKPQGPANQTTADSAALAMAYVNMCLAEQADKECTAFVKEQEESYTLDDCNYWYSYLLRNDDGQQIKKDDLVDIFYTVSTLDGTLIEDTEEQIKVGKRESLLVLDLMLEFNKIHEGEELLLVAPYYLVYGREDNEKVKACTNCIIEIRQLHIIQ